MANWFKPMKIHRALRSLAPAGLAVCALLVGCASTTVETTGNMPAAPLCQTPGVKLSALVLWGPNWRPDQKDVPQREEAARQGIESFFASSGCFAKCEVRRLAGGGSADMPNTQELLALAAAASPRPDRVLVVTVRELGPVVRLLGAAALVEGGTEVVFELAAIDARSGTSLAGFRMHWRDGGAMVVKGTASLPQDMGAALKTALSPSGASP